MQTSILTDKPATFITYLKHNQMDTYEVSSGNIVILISSTSGFETI